MRTLIALLLIVALLAGCGPTDDNTDTTDSQDTETTDKEESNQDTSTEETTEELNESLVSDPGEVEIGEMI